MFKYFSHLVLALLISLFFLSSIGYSQMSANVELLGTLDPQAGRYGDIWGYVDPTTGKEYALLCARDVGLYVVDVSDPSNPTVASVVPHPEGSFDTKDVKTYQNFAFVVHQSGPLQIVDLSDPANPTDTTFTNPSLAGGFHNIFIDDKGFGYISIQTGSAQADMRIFDLSDPNSPVEVGVFFHPQPIGFVESHDVYVRNDTGYVAYLQGGFVMLDLTDKSNPQELATVIYPGAFTHNVWTTEDGKYAFTTDEYPGGHLQVFDVRDPSDVNFVGEFTADSRAIIHDVHVRSNLAYISYYTEGLWIVDISDPTFPVEVGYYDTSPASPGQFAGNWGVYPFFPSGNVVASDMQSGLFVFQFTATGIAPGRVEGTVTDSQTGNPIEDVLVQILETGRSVRTPMDGSYRAGGTPGLITLVFSKETNYSGFNPDTLQLTLKSGITLPGSIALTPLPSGSLRGRLSHSGTGGPVPEVQLKVEGTPLVSFTDMAGDYSFPVLLADTSYTLSALKFGFQTDSLEVLISPMQETIQDITLIRDLADDADTDFQWSMSSPGDNATVGLWERADPHLVTFPVFGPVVQPGTDHTVDGEFAFVTGATSSPSDNPDGRTTLTSPEFDVTDFADPVVNYFRWFYTNAPGEDFLQVELSSDGGETWTTLENISDVESEWKLKFFRISDFTTPTTRMKIRFVAADDGAESLVEALMDDFRVTDGVSTLGGDQLMIPTAYRLEQNYPNPFNPSTTIEFSLPRSGFVKLTVYSTLGEEVATLVSENLSAGRYSAEWDATGSASGVYFYRLSVVPEARRDLVPTSRDGQAGEYVETKKLIVLK